ncbi:CARD19 isoform 2 [Pongo abelii]|uniref:Caspase recruitment domain-containing protein 19 n=1 Tax=Pongo abelii TaxID=9601 RepID=A0A2J8WNV4_PONAB|nr:CARD19 isoform 2 [Pongo abelii]
MTDQTYCDRLVQDMPFLTGHGRLSEQQVDRIILQLNRYYPQILTNKEAEKFRNPKASLRVRLCDLLSHLQRSGERDCQEFYRALYIHAQPLHSRLPSRHALRKFHVPNHACLVLAQGGHPSLLLMAWMSSMTTQVCCSPGLASPLTSAPPQRPPTGPEGRMWQAQAVQMLVSVSHFLLLPPSLSLMAVFTQHGASCTSTLALPFLTSFHGDPFMSVWTAALFPQLHGASRWSQLELPNPMTDPFIAAICTRRTQIAQS